MCYKMTWEIIIFGIFILFFIAVILYFVLKGSGYTVPGFSCSLKQMQDPSNLACYNEFSNLAYALNNNPDAPFGLGNTYGSTVTTNLINQPTIVQPAVGMTLPGTHQYSDVNARQFRGIDISK